MFDGRGVEGSAFFYFSDLWLRGFRVWVVLRVIFVSSFPKPGKPEPLVVEVHLILPCRL